MKVLQGVPKCPPRSKPLRSQPVIFQRLCCCRRSYSAPKVISHKSTGQPFDCETALPNRPLPLNISMNTGKLSEGQTDWLSAPWTRYLPDCLLLLCTVFARRPGERRRAAPGELPFGSAALSSGFSNVPDAAPM